jgi:glutamyl-Q tRNA(Asp) synthetase
VRIEDLDRPREAAGAADHILRTLERLGLYWDGPAVFQSRRTELYRHAVNVLQDQTYWCGCSRREIADSSLGQAADGAQIYPGTCGGGLPPDKIPRALRVRTGPETVRFQDRVQGLQEQNLGAEVGDFVLCRADGVYAYQLAVVVDDAEQAITDIVRGADLLGSTARQLHLQRLLGYPTPQYLHVPMAVNAAGEKLSKQSGAPAIDAREREELLRSALGFLGQDPIDNLADAIRNWNTLRIPASRCAIAPGARESLP